MKERVEAGRSFLLRRFAIDSCKHIKADISKTSDLILMILDATKRAEQRALLEGELEAVGIRLNREPPYDVFATFLVP